MDDEQVGRMFTQLAAGQEILTSSLTTMAEGITQMRVAIMSKLERIEDQLTNVREDMQVTMNAVGNEGDRRRSDRNELNGMGQMVSDMQRQILRLRTDVDDLKKRSA